MAEPASGVAVDWAQLRAKGIGERFAAELPMTVPAILKSPMAEPAAELGADAPQFAAVVALLGGQALKPLLDQIRSHVDEALRTLRTRPLSVTTSSRLGFLSVLNTLECGGLVDQPFAGAAASALASGIADESSRLVEAKMHTLGLVAVAVGKPELVPKLVGGGKLAAKVKPGQTFQFNVPGFVRYLAVASTAGADAAAVRPAWLDFLQAFPYKLAAQTLNWTDLLWAARIYYHGFEKRPAAQVADALRAEVASP